MKAYLIAYNAIQCVGWSFILYKTILHQLDQPSIIQGGGLWSKISTILIYFQVAAILEVIHCLVGIVKAPWVTTAIQVASRVVVLMGVCFYYPEAQESIFFTTMIICWSVTEVVRYAFYVFELVGLTPYPIKWLRYSMFLVLYPAGIISEIGCIVVSLNTVYHTSTGYFVFLIICLFAYVPGAPTMILHMIKQRKSKLNPSTQPRASQPRSNKKTE